MAAAWVVPFLAGLVASLFAARVWGQWSIRRRPHQLAWASGLTLYAVATFVDAYVAAGGWSVAAYRVFFAAAAGNVGLLGLGTLLLARTAWGGRFFGALVLAGFLVAALGQFAIPLSVEAPVGTCVEDSGPPCRSLREWGTELGAKAIPWSSPARWAFLILNVVGGLALIGGALLSWWQTRAPGVLLIGLGAMLPFLGGSLSTVQIVDMRVLMQLLGIVVMFLGYLRAREATPPAVAPRAAGG